ncbi:MAG TPA: vanadium-dependent haloperoxidase [Solirubrobacteraceae bacterium]|nr:vanadium-dependent haloperoxidase [Solirubrobacteraceae bacterium]
MRAHRARFAVLMAVATLAVSAPARADTVTEWNLNTSNELFRVGVGQGAFAAPNLAMVQLAVFDAVNAIDRRYTPYLTAPPAKRWYSKDAAVAAAAHRVLIDGHLVATEAQQDALEVRVNDLYAAALATIEDGPAKRGGIATGEAAGWAMVAARTEDGRFGDPGFTLADPLRAGDWRPTLPMNVNDPGAWLKDVEPFMIRRASQFRSRGPFRLTSRRYAEEFNEVKQIGKSDSATRTGDQTTTARFWGGPTNAVATWSDLIRTLADARPLTTVDRARFYALVYLTGADTAIATWADKAHWMFWRPITAIREADTDRNPATEADADWLPLIPNPPYPDHSSGLAAFGASNVSTLQELFGTDRVAFRGVNSIGIVRNYTRLSQVIDEIVDARVWSGIHFRAADEQGAKLGREVARWRRDHHLLERPR